MATQSGRHVFAQPFNNILSVGQVDTFATPLLFATPPIFFYCIMSYHAPLILPTPLLSDPHVTHTPLLLYLLRRTGRQIRHLMIQDRVPMTPTPCPCDPTPCPCDPSTVPL